MMGLKKIADEYYFQDHRYCGKSLSWVLEHDSYWLIEYAVCVYSQEDAEIMMAALREREIEKKRKGEAALVTY